MAPPKQPQPCAKFQYVVTAAGPKIVPVPDVESKDEESPADYNSGGYLQVKIRDTFKEGRYVVVRKLGWGHFSTVWLVKDLQENRHSALKVVKSAGRYAETARDEIKLLRQVASANPSHPGREHVVSFLDSFQHCGPEDIHVCIVFEPLGENLLALIERHKKKGVPQGLVKVIAKQVLLGLMYLHDECDLVHTDIKPENIMLAIPDVESHIQQELSTSQSPTCRKVGVPLPKATRSGMAIPKRASTAEYSYRQQRHVQIFDSQPLSSPSQSPKMRNGLVMSRISSGASLNEPPASVNKKLPGIDVTKTPVKKDSADSVAESSSSSGSSGTTLSSPSSAMVSSISGTSSTPPTSLGSAMSRLTLSDSDCLSRRSTLDSQISEGKNSASPTESSDPTPVPSTSTSSSNTIPGPSLLSQTAPRDPHAPTPDAPSVEPAPSSPAPPQLPEEPLVEEPASLPPIMVKIADLGNATPSKRHYTEDIQTRQYRCPEAILGRSDWGCTADIWSVACVIFELLTAEYLFDPQGQGELFTKDDDHMAQIIELLGDFPMDVKMGGKFSRELFDSTGALRYIKSLKLWPLKNVMMEKYSYTEQDAQALCDFLLPMLVIDHRERASAHKMVNHPWLDVSGLEIDDDF
ncbi:kinase-like protein [Gloeophyllum trabeum ATCC 11539]|uniref:non-specific serine/threonine protein kinase n=1 Tax=Gloeophyllum trabeum (strain ATCC 11539 / FP-39264 / Madison 617) TaxID=670483 RepID=S7QNC6_GLOTA|nr:kinase-like protein [Gloeophyllum trabeum ATCC 11539]EPQ61003.1 kinase-like protein [Gloeophyllum trabeum ATCC 11539]